MKLSGGVPVVLPCGELPRIERRLVVAKPLSQTYLRLGLHFQIADVLVHSAFLRIDIHANAAVLRRRVDHLLGIQIVDAGNSYLCHAPSRSSTAMKELPRRISAVQESPLNRPEAVQASRRKSVAGNRRRSTCGFLSHRCPTQSERPRDARFKSSGKRKQNKVNNSKR